MAQGVPLSHFSRSEIHRFVIERGVSEASASTIGRWLAEDAIRPWRHRSWIFPRDPEFLEKADPVLDLYEGRWEGKLLEPSEGLPGPLISTTWRAPYRRNRTRTYVPSRFGWMCLVGWLRSLVWRFRFVLLLVLLVRGWCGVVGMASRRIVVSGGFAGRVMVMRLIASRRCSRAKASRGRSAWSARLSWRSGRVRRARGTIGSRRARSGTRWSRSRGARVISRRPRWRGAQQSVCPVGV
jgi:hypothetical protein